MFDTTDRVSSEVVAAIEALRPPMQPTPLRIEDCTTPELRLEYIAQWLEAGGEARHGIAGFNMGLYYQQRSCGTICCIAGAAVQFFDPRGVREIDACIPERARDLLGIEAGNRLFVPIGWRENPDQFTPAWAARCIRKYQRTGIVDWEGTR